MPDGKRRRRWNSEARRRWYAAWRSARFNRRLGNTRVDFGDIARTLAVAVACKS